MIDPITYPPELPISSRRDELLDALRRHQVLVVAGATGSGKSTQLPKLCLEAGRGTNGWIGHTQPRRIAARSIAERIADELGDHVGGVVGYKVRFNDEVGADTAVKVMTDGILLAELQRDRDLRRYDTLIVDEAHERSLNIDFLLGYLHRLLPRRPDLHLVITSATIDTARFSEHFGGAPIIEVEGRTYPVEIRYRPLDDPAAPPGTEARDQAEGIVDAVRELQREVDGDVLVFCSGEREIRDAATALAEADLPDTEVFPLFARLSSAEQHRVFEPHRGRRVVVATNVAETSLTVPGIRAVVDPGTARISRYSQRTKVQRLPIEPISQASANQRSGRCGRLGPGICIRLYDEADFASRPEFTEPEIRRTNLASVILQMTALRLGDVGSFPFVDPPADRNVRDGIALLEELGALVDGKLTRLGRQLVRLPVDPRLGRMVLEAGTNGCLREVIVICTALSIQDPRERPFEHRAAADQSHARFTDQRSDFLTLLRLWEYLLEQRTERSSSGFRRMCRQEFLHHNRIREWQDLVGQLRRAIRPLGFVENDVPATPDAIHLSLLTGLLSHVGMRDQPPDPTPGGRAGERGRRPPTEYVGARQARFVISPPSPLAKRPPPWVMAGELVETDRLRARTAAPVDPAWVERAGAHLAKRSHGDVIWKPEAGTAMTVERVTVFGLPVQPGRRVPLRRVDPELARDLFIEHALVDGDWSAHHRFQDRNAATRERAEAVGARARRGDLVADRTQLFDFYDERIPLDVTDGPSFNRWWKEERRHDGQLLDLTLDDLLVDDAHALVDPAAFPETWTVDGHDLPITYEFDPTSDADGATITVEVAMVGRLDPATFDWNVPGFRAELVEALLRSLPKQWRRLFVPIPETVAEIADGLRPGEGAVVDVVRRELNRLVTSPLPPDAFDLSKVPAHLRPRFRVVDAVGNELAGGRDLAELAERVRAESRAEAATVELDHHVDGETTGLRTWSIGDLPRRVERSDARHVVAFPALHDDGDSVSVVACASEAEQATVHWAGVRRLIRLAMPAPARQVDALLDQRTKQLMAVSPVQAKVDWYHDIIDASLDHLLAEAGGPTWTLAAFEQRVGRVRDGLAETLAATAAAAAELVGVHAVVLGALDRLAAGPAAEAVADSIADVREQLDRLLYPGVLVGAGADRIGDLVRYLRAAEHRVAQLPGDLRRDRDRMAAVRALEAEFDRIAPTALDVEGVEALVWQLEELRVGTFAQRVGTAGKVSETRIRNELLRLARGE